jgi:benzil reductase ((S)-benzoin forming)
MFLVTGGGSGIGRALAHALSARNKQVLIVGRREQALAKTAAFSSLINYLCADITTDKGRQQIIMQLREAPSLEAIVHNAGIIEPIAPITAIEEPAWQRLMATNVNAPLFLTQLLLDKLQKGRVLSIGSGAAYFPVAGWAAYCTSKAALAMLMRCWQLESQDTAFANVMPGIINTDMQAIIRYAAGMDNEKQQFFQNLYKEEQLLAPATVALFLTWLLLDIPKSEFIAKEWDIYDQTHHTFWLTAPHKVPHWEKDE